MSAYKNGLMPFILFIISLSNSLEVIEKVNVSLSLVFIGKQCLYFLFLIIWGIMFIRNYKEFKGNEYINDIKLSLLIALLSYLISFVSSWVTFTLIFVLGLYDIIRVRKKFM